MSVLFNPYDLYIPRHTSLALSISLIAHAVLFTIGWKLYKTEIHPMIKPSLSVVLVNRKTLHAPKTARSWAQANLDGGGQPSQRGHSARTTAIENPVQQEENLSGNQNGHISPSTNTDSKPLQQGNTTSNTPYMTRKSSANVALHQPEAQTEQSPPHTTPSAIQTPTSIPNIAGKLSETLDSGQEGRASKVLGANTREYRMAGYIDGLRQKILRVGNSSHYKSLMKSKKLYGAANITLRLHADGKVEFVKVTCSSGSSAFNDMLKDIVLHSSPYDPFPDTLRAEISVWTITRTFVFGTQDAEEVALKC